MLATPFRLVDMRYMTMIQVRIGSLLDCITVPVLTLK